MNHIVFTFGRFNPPTKGHQKLVEAVVDISRKENADHCIFLSHSQNPNTDPLSWALKHRVCKEAFHGVSICSDTNVKTPFQALEMLSLKYKKATMVVGSDQVNEFRDRMSLYATRWGISLDVVSAGIRDNSNTVSGISASRLRQYARDGHRLEFFRWLPDNLCRVTKSLVYSETVAALKTPIKRLSVTRK